MDYDTMLLKAKQTIETKVEIGKVFKARDLFESIEWEKLKKGERITFGKLFANAVMEGKIPQVKRVERNKNNHSQYIKTEV